MMKARRMTTQHYYSPSAEKVDVSRESFVFLGIKTWAKGGKETGKVGAGVRGGMEKKKGI